MAFLIRLIIEFIFYPDETAIIIDANKIFNSPIIGSALKVIGIFI